MMASNARIPKFKRVRRRCIAPCSRKLRKLQSGSLPRELIWPNFPKNSLVLSGPQKRVVNVRDVSSELILVFKDKIELIFSKRAELQSLIPNYLYLASLFDCRTERNYYGACVKCLKALLSILRELR